MSVLDVLNIYISFFEKNGHKRIENSSLVPQNDPSTLFTSSGMQPIIKYLLGEPHPEGKRLVNVQNCFRAQDIEEVGDNRHTTFFRMLGNWSLGDYFKNEEIPWFWELLTSELKLDPKRLYVSVFAGYKDIEKDDESATIWKSLFTKAGIDPTNRIFYCGVEDNWWSRSGTPDHMPTGEPGGPDTEVYFDLKPNEEELDSDLSKNIDSGRFLEIGNSVFMTYQKKADGGFKELKQKNVDFGGGLERILAAVELKQDIFETSLLRPIIKAVQDNILTKHVYGSDKKTDRAFRLITDHLIAATFVINEGVIPGNKDRGYIVRRLIRRAVAQKYLWGDISKDFGPIVEEIADAYSPTDPDVKQSLSNIKNVINEEEKKAGIAIDASFVVWRRWVEENPSGFGTAMFGEVMFGESTKLPPLPAEKIFDLYQSYGLSLDIIKEIAQGNVDEEGFNKLLEEHKKVSRKGSEKKFVVR